MWCGVVGCGVVWCGAGLGERESYGVELKQQKQHKYWKNKIDNNNNKIDNNKIDNNNKIDKKNNNHNKNQRRMASVGPRPSLSCTLK